MALLVTDLPMEVIENIFSFLMCNELYNVSIVCSKFNEATKHRSLWKRCKMVIIVELDDHYKVPSFCDFFMRSPTYLQELYIHKAAFGSSSRLSKEHWQSLGLLFENLTHLHCLNTNIDLETFVLPPSLRHLRCRVIGTETNRHMSHFSFLENCPNIERLFITARNPQYLCNAFESLFLKYQYSLTSLLFQTDYFHKKWIADCKNLKELVLFQRKNVPVIDCANLFDRSLSFSLEVLVVKYMNQTMFLCLCDCVFSELKQLIIFEAPAESLKVYLPLVVDRMPKLQAFCFSDGRNNFHANNDEKIINCMAACKSLRYLAISKIQFYNYSQQDFQTKIAELNARCSLEDQWKVSDSINKDIFLLSAYMCYCWNPSKNLLKNYIDKVSKTLVLWS